MALLQSLYQISFLHQFSAGAIHQADALLHLLDRGLVDHSSSLRGEAYVQRDVIRGRVKLVQADQPDALLLGHADRNKRIMPDYFHLKGACPPRDFHADATESGDS